MTTLLEITAAEVRVGDEIWNSKFGCWMQICSKGPGLHEDEICFGTIWAGHGWVDDEPDEGEGTTTFLDHSKVIVRRSPSPPSYEPTDEDQVLAHELVKDGWLSVSNSAREVARFTSLWPSAEKLIHPALIGTLPGELLIKFWNERQGTCLRDLIDCQEYVERRALTITQFRAFKRAGGRPA